ncbi:hypothetical protein ACO1ZG_21170 [Enterobacter kobei]|uniref:hypothetical protein n=1 Tax=Enterobacter kobei TaxID=208224 RepID=UPI0032F6D215|nr:hypothetical protein [Enterobacter asburiae]
MITLLVLTVMLKGEVAPPVMYKYPSEMFCQAALQSAKYITSGGYKVTMECRKTDESTDDKGITNGNFKSVLASFVQNTTKVTYVSTINTFPNGEACYKDLKRQQEETGMLTPGVQFCIPGSSMAQTSPPPKSQPIPRLEVTEALKEKALNAAKITLKRRYYKVDSTTIWPEPKVIVGSDNSTFRYDAVDTPSEETKMRIDIVITNAGKIVQTPTKEVFR